MSMWMVSTCERNWGGEYENVAILVAIAVNEDGYREVLGAAEGMKEDKASWVSFFQWLRGRGLDGVKLIVGDKCLGMLEAVGEVFPEAKYQRCMVHFYRNVFSVVPQIQGEEWWRKCSRPSTPRKARRHPGKRPPQWLPS
ncbi:MAG: transposase [Oscillospiraceae bacterium]